MTSNLTPNPTNHPSKTSSKTMPTDTKTAEPKGELRHINSNLTFSRDRVKKAVQDLPEDLQRDILWAFQLAKDSDWNLKELAQEIGYSTSTWHRVFSGAYEGSLTNIQAKIQSYRKLYEARQAAVSPDFIKTSLTERIWQACDFALISQSVVFIWGENQIGKTHALEEYQRTHNHGQTIYVRMPASAGVQLVAKLVAKACGISPNSSFEKLRERIMAGIDDKNTIIFDEMHQAFLTYQKGSALKVLEFIREIYDRTKCGMVLCGTNVWRNELNHGQHKKVLDQLRNRGVAHIQLEDRPRKGDLRKFWKFYGLADPDGAAATVVKDLVAEHGLGKFIKFLQTAARMASKRKEDLTWQHFLTAHETIVRLSQKSQES